MINKRLLVGALCVAVVATACVDNDTEPSTTTDQAQGTSITSTTTTESADSRSLDSGTTTTETLREVEEVGCDEAPETVAIVCEAYELIQTRYVDDIADDTLASAAIRGLEFLDGASGVSDPFTCALPSEAFAPSCDIAAARADSEEEAAEAIVIGLAVFALDPNSAYFDRETLELLEEEQGGQIEGIGALVSPEDETIEDDNDQCAVISATCRIRIVSTISGAPAEAAGLEPDDYIVAVDGMSMIDWTIDEVTALVRGPAGTDVRLTIERDGETFDVTITRAAVVIPIIESDRFGDTGYVRLSVFNQSADDQFEEAVIDLLAEGVDRLVIDLRGNPGGLLDTAIAVTSVFLEEGDVVVTQGPDQRRSYPVTGGSVVPESVEVIFVVNEGSASASELVSAVLQERGRATLVGEATFGKNTVQQRFGLSNGGALKLTIARWLTPGGLDFGGAGVMPDIELELDEGMTPEAVVETVLAST